MIGLRLPRLRLLRLSRLARLSGQLVSGLSGRLQGLGRFSRSQRLVAAHKVIVITAYFEAMSSARLPFDPRELSITASAQVSLATGQVAQSGRLKKLAEHGVCAELGFVLGIVGFTQGIVCLVGTNAELYRAMGRPDINTKLMFGAILYYLPVYLTTDARLDGFHSDPRFKDLVRRIGLPE